MHILCLAVVEQQSAVRVTPAERHTVAVKEVGDDVMPQKPQIAGDDEVIVLRLRARVAKECRERVICRR